MTSFKGSNIWYEQRDARTAKQDILEDFFDQHPNEGYTVKDIQAQVFSAGVRLHSIRDLLSDMAVRQPHKLLVSREVKLINGLKRSVLVFRKNHDSKPEPELSDGID